MALTTRAAAALRPRPVPWPTVVVFAVLMAFSDGFVLTSIQGAVGAIERSQSPFTGWLRDSALMLPAYLLAVLVALALARRRLGPSLRTGRKILATALLVAAAGTLVAFGEVAASAADDYHLQSEQLIRTSHLHSEHGPGTAGCPGPCTALARTRETDERAARYATTADLAANVFVVGWVLALRGGRLEAPGPRERSPRAAAARR